MSKKSILDRIVANLSEEGRRVLAQEELLLEISETLLTLVPSRGRRSAR